MNAQGEDVVAGIRTPQPISHLADQMPEVYEQFANIAQSLEDHYKDMQDMEFTIEGGKLYMLQTRNGKRTAPAALKIAVDLVKEGKLTEEEAILKVELQAARLAPPSDVQRGRAEESKTDRKGAAGFSWRCLQVNCILRLMMRRLLRQRVTRSFSRGRKLRLKISKVCTLPKASLRRAAA